MTGGGFWLDAFEDGPLVSAVVTAFEAEAGSEAEFIERVAFESGGLGSLLGGLGRLWGAVTKRLRGGGGQPPALPPPPRMPTGQTPILPPPPSAPPGGPYGQPIPRPPRLPKGLGRFEDAVEDAFEAALEDLYESQAQGPPSSSSAPTRRRWGSGRPSQPPPTLRSGAPPSERTRLAQWLVSGLVRRGTPAARAVHVDPFDGFEAVLEAAIEADEMETAAPLLAGLAVRRAMPQASGLSPEMRRRLIAAATTALRRLSHRSGLAGARAAPALVQSVGRIADFKGLPPKALPPAIARSAIFLAGRPDVIRRMAAIGSRAGT